MSMDQQGILLNVAPEQFQLGGWFCHCVSGYLPLPMLMPSSIAG